MWTIKEVKKNYLAEALKRRKIRKSVRTKTDKNKYVNPLLWRDKKENRNKEYGGQAAFVKKISLLCWEKIKQVTIVAPTTVAYWGRNIKRRPNKERVPNRDYHFHQGELLIICICICICICIFIIQKPTINTTLLYSCQWHWQCCLSLERLLQMRLIPVKI